MTQSDDDDVPELTAATAAALREFLAEAEAARAAAAERSGKDGDGDGGGDGGDDPFSVEDWQLSQFWYTDETARDAAAAVIAAATARVEEEEEEEVIKEAASEVEEEGKREEQQRRRRRRRLPRIACVACPSLFRAIKLDASFSSACEAHLFEFDDRFAKFAGEGRFSHYDYRRPLRVDERLRGAFDAVVADPPFLSAECLRKTAKTMRLLACARSSRSKSSGSVGEDGEESNENALSRPPAPPPPPVLVLLSGSVQRHRAAAYLALKPVVWRPSHSNKLANEFLLMTDSERVAAELGGFDDELPIDPVEDEGEGSDDDDEDGGGDDDDDDGATVGEKKGEEEGAKD